MGEQRAGGVIARIATKYGLIQGVISLALFIAAIMAGIRQSWIGSVVNTVILIVLMVLAQLEFKRPRHGMMTYAQGLGTGTLLSSIGALIRCVFTYIYLKYINTGYLAAAIQAQRTVFRQRGLTGAQAQLAMGITSAITTPTGIAVTALISGVIGGFIVALIVSLFTQKTDPMAVI